MGTRRTSVRKVLVIFQFFISSVLIISTLLIQNQLKFIQNRDIGIYKDNIVYFNSNNLIDNNYDYFKEKLKQQENIISVTRTFQMPSFYGIGMTGTIEGIDEYINFDVGIADADHLNTFGIQLLEGRNFDDKLLADTNSIIINESAAKLYKENPLGKKMELANNGNVIGIVKDYNYRPLDYPIKPMALFPDKSKYDRIAIRYKEGTKELSEKHIENTFKEFCPNYTFGYTEFIEDFEYFYRDETRLIKLIGYFTFLGILISALGLLGLSSFVAEQRTKEIGIRKVNGATILNIFKLLNIDFIKLVFIGYIISCPVSYFILQNWLTKFVYKTELSFWVFVLAGIITLFISALTMSLHAYKASVRNPVDSLRYE